MKGRKRTTKKNEGIRKKPKNTSALEK